MNAPALQLAPRQERERPAARDLPRFSPTVHLWFVRYLRRYFARNFDAVRVSRECRVPRETDRPLIIYANHPSWWDPIVLLLLIRTHYDDWRFHAPIDAAALARYPWLERLGLFPVEADRLSGARRFLEAGSALLGSERTGLALTAQGEFADVRERPVRIRRGVAHLLERHPGARAFPIAIEYAFWNERLPEVLVRFGQRPITAGGRGIEAIHGELEQALEHQLDRLARAAITRDAGQFDALLDGRRGVGLIQDLPLRLRALFRGERFDPSHSAVPTRRSGSR